MTLERSIAEFIRLFRVTMEAVTVEWDRLVAEVETTWH